MSNNNLNVAVNVPKREVRVRVVGIRAGKDHYTLNTSRENDVLTLSVARSEVATGNTTPYPSWKQALDADVNYVIVKDENGGTAYEGQV